MRFPIDKARMTLTAYDGRSVLSTKPGSRSSLDLANRPHYNALDLAPPRHVKTATKRRLVPVYAPCTCLVTGVSGLSPARDTAYNGWVELLVVLRPKGETAFAHHVMFFAHLEESSIEDCAKKSFQAWQQLDQAQRRAIYLNQADPLSVCPSAVLDEGAVLGYLRPSQGSFARHLHVEASYCPPLSGDQQVPITFRPVDPFLTFVDLMNLTGDLPRNLAPSEFRAFFRGSGATAQDERELLSYDERSSLVKRGAKTSKWTTVGSALQWVSAGGLLTPVILTERAAVTVDSAKKADQADVTQIVAIAPQSELTKGDLLYAPIVTSAKPTLLKDGAKSNHQIMTRTGTFVLLGVGGVIVLIIALLAYFGVFDRWDTTQVKNPLLKPLARLVEAIQALDFPRYGVSKCQVVLTANGVLSGYRARRLIMLLNNRLLEYDDMRGSYVRVHRTRFYYIPFLDLAGETGWWALTRVYLRGDHTVLELRPDDPSQYNNVVRLLARTNFLKEANNG